MSGSAGYGMGDAGQTLSGAGLPPGPMLAVAAGALLLAGVHAASPLLRALDGIPRARLLSLASGITVAFVLLRLLPVLGREEATVQAALEGTVLASLRYPLYLTALAGILLYYGVERMAQLARRTRRAREGTDCASGNVFALSLLTFAGMHFLIGRLLADYAAQGLDSLASFIVAMALKFLVDDHGMYGNHKAQYLTIGRWVLALAVLVGAAFGVAVGLPAWVPAVIQAFLIGAVLFNVLKEELPVDRQSRYWTFALGALLYATLLATL